jgi:hypothetical protein
MNCSNSSNVPLNVGYISKKSPSLDSSITNCNSSSSGDCGISNVNGVLKKKFLFIPIC